MFNQSSVPLFDSNEYLSFQKSKSLLFSPYLWWLGVCVTPGKTHWRWLLEAALHAKFTMGSTHYRDPQPSGCNCWHFPFLFCLSMRSPHNCTSWNHLLLWEEMLFADKHPTTHKCHAEKVSVFGEMAPISTTCFITEEKQMTKLARVVAGTQSSQHLPEWGSRRMLERDFFFVEKLIF